ncbi:MAG TPA: hypothetical protein VMB21_03585 [Candidatus Limnocylindria bacterium]|jgi:hypothetical protein|nr:hypothetical protein [Candidatus Limnocylindria bacterium]
MNAQRDCIRELKPSPERWIGMLAGSLLFAVMGGIMASNGEWLMGGVGIAFGVIGIVVSPAALFSKRMMLRLTPQGFGYGTLRKKYFYKWGDVAGFGVGNVVEKQACFTLREDFMGEEKVRTINRRWIGFERFLPDTYGMKAMELAKLMEEWRFLYSQSNNAQN